MSEKHIGAILIGRDRNIFPAKVLALSLPGSLLLFVTLISAAYAFAVYGDIGKKYSSVGGESGLLGKPLNDESPVPEGGRFNDFQNGSIYWHPQTGAHIVLGAIRAHWLEIGFGDGWLGFPTTDELTTSDGIGRYNHFHRIKNNADTSMYWTPKTGPVEIYGDIRKEWARLGWEKSYLGYPIAAERNEYDRTPIRSQDFQKGKLWWSPKTGVTPTPDAPIKAYSAASAGGSSGGSGFVPPSKKKVFKLCDNLTCDACKRDYKDNGVCEPSSQCNSGPNGFACYAYE